jgi:hypothetical protein
MLGDLYSEHYYNDRGSIDKDKHHLHRLLHNYRHHRPNIFRSYTRITPAAFDALLDAIKDDPVFQSGNSNNRQMPVEEQLAIALYRFGHYGNAAGQMKTALWAGVGYHTV